MVLDPKERSSFTLAALFELMEKVGVSASGIKTVEEAVTRLERSRLDAAGDG